jgi:hypothetical protein
MPARSAAAHAYPSHEAHAEHGLSVTRPLWCSDPGRARVVARDGRATRRLGRRP